LISCKPSKISAVRKPSVTSKNLAKRKQGDDTGIRRFFGARDGNDSMSRAVNIVGLHREGCIRVRCTDRCLGSSSGFEGVR